MVEFMWESREAQVLWPWQLGGCMPFAYIGTGGDGGEIALDVQVLPEPGEDGSVWARAEGALLCGDELRSEWLWRGESALSGLQLLRELAE